MTSLLKIVKAGNFVISDEVFTIKEPPGPGHLQDTPGGVEGGLPPQEQEPQPDPEEIAAMIIAKASEEAGRIIENAMMRVQNESEVLLERARREAVDIRTQARQEGQMQGVQEKTEAIGACIAGLELAVSRMEGEQAGFLSEYENNLHWMALEIATRVLNHRVEENDLELIHLVKAAVESVKNAEWVRVELSEEAGGLIDHLSQELKRVDNDRVEVGGVAAPKGTCVLDTPQGRVDASVFTQLSNLKEYFANFSGA